MSFYSKRQRTYTLSVVACKSLPQCTVTCGLRSWARNVNKGGCSFGPGEPRRGRRRIYLDCCSETPTPLSPCRRNRTAQGSTGAAQPITGNILLIEINTQWRAWWTAHLRYNNWHNHHCLTICVFIQTILVSVTCVKVTRRTILISYCMSLVGFSLTSANDIRFLHQICSIRFRPW